MLPKKLNTEYTLLKEYFEGGQSKTFLVEKDQKKYIVKVPKSSKLSSERKFRLEREIKALELMNGIGVPKLYDFSLSEDIYIIMDFIPGKTLSEFIVSNKVDLDNAIDLIKSICDVIEKAHKIGLFHRDLKPDNIIISDLTNKPIVIDFGICWLIDDKTFKTKKGIELGNRFLRLPELSKGTDVTVSTSDITFIVGLLFFLITKKQPHILLNENGEMPHQREEFKNLKVLENTILKQIFDRGFTYEVALRYQTPLELKLDLDKVLSNMENEEKSNNAIEKLDKVFNNDFYKKKKNHIEIISKCHKEFLTYFSKSTHKSLSYGGSGPNFAEGNRTVETKMFVLQSGTSEPKVQFYLLSKFNESYDLVISTYGTENFQEEQQHTIKENTKMSELYPKLGELIADKAMQELLPKIKIN